MKLESYELSVEDNIFLFFSVGRNGVLPKVIVFEPIAENIFNLAFGDLNIETGEISDKSISNNGDTKKIMATVVKSIAIFLDKYPNAQVNFIGSTPSRTKLYLRIIVNYSQDFQNKYLIFGIEEGKNISTEIDLTKDYSEFSIIKT